MAKFQAEFKNNSGFNANFTSDDVFKSEFSNVQPVTTNIHNELQGRSENDAHPISAITGLENRLSDIESNSVTPEERESWNNKSRVYRNASGALVITI